MIFDWTVSVGNLINLLLLVVGACGLYYGLYYGLENSVAMIKQSMDFMGGRLINIENELRGVEKTLDQVARQDERLQAMDMRVARLERRADHEEEDRFHHR